MRRHPIFLVAILIIAHPGALNARFFQFFTGPVKRAKVFLRDANPAVAEI
jgi:hypothetical protein